MKKKIAILGAGPAGLSLGFNLLHKYGNDLEIVIIDRENRVGGISASFSEHGLYFDYGSHRLHPSVSPQLYSDIKGMLGERLLTRPRNGRIRLLNRFVKFPLNPVDATLHLPPHFMLGVMKDSVTKRFKKKNINADSFKEVLLECLGETICNKFYFPYGEKLWGLKPELLAAEQARKRVSSNSIVKIIKKAFSSIAGKNTKSGAIFYYPDKGFGSIPDAYGHEIEKMGGTIILKSEIQKITLLKDSRFKIETEQNNESGSRVKQNLEFDFVFSTIPLNFLTKIIEPKVSQEVSSAASALRYRGMLFHYLILKTDQFTSFDAHYFPETEFLFSRISETKNYYNSKEPQGITGICNEIPCMVDDKIWNLSENELTKRVISDLNKCGLAIDMPVADSFVRKLPTVYPVYDLVFEQNFEIVDEYFSKLPNFVLLGRQGLFVHDNAHHTLEMGYRASECLDKDLSWDQNKWMKFREEFKEHVVVD